MVNQPCPIFKVSQQIAGTICPINIYKKHQVYKYYSRELCPKDLCLFCSELSGVTDIFYPQIPSIALLNYVIKFIRSESPRKILRYTYPLN